MSKTKFVKNKNTTRKPSTRKTSTRTPATAPMLVIRPYTSVDTPTLDGEY
jgi:hypothetical protein